MRPGTVRAIAGPCLFPLHPVLVVVVTAGVAVARAAVAVLLRRIALVLLGVAVVRRAGILQRVVIVVDGLRVLGLHGSVVLGQRNFLLERRQVGILFGRRRDFVALRHVRSNAGFRIFRTVVGHRQRAGFGIGRAQIVWRHAA